MSALNPKGRIAQLLYDLDSRVNSGCYSAYDWLCRAYSAYAAFLGRWRIRGLKRVLADLVSDGATLGLIFTVGVSVTIIARTIGGDITEGYIGESADLHEELQRVERKILELAGRSENVRRLKVVS